MGNCCFKTGSSMGWDGEDWGSLTSKRSSKVFDEGGHGLSLGNVEREKVIGMLRASSDADGKVKIKISKKELKKLLGGTETEKKKQQADHHHEGHGQHGHASAEQVLVGLINARDHHDHHHRPWKPALQSIPEFN